MKFRTYAEPPEPMRGLEVPPEVVESLGQGKRPRVTITVNGRSWKSRVAIMRGRYLLGLSSANRQAAGVETGDEVEVELEFDPEPRVVAEPADFARALSADPRAQRNPRRAYGGSRRHWQRCGTWSRQAHRGPREDPSFEVDVRRVPNWTIPRSARRWWRVDDSSRSGRRYSAGLAIAVVPGLTPARPVGVPCVHKRPRPLFPRASAADVGVMV
jgi:hypothetical protein